jgi:hypothetical protein
MSATGNKPIETDYINTSKPEQPNWPIRTLPKVGFLGNIWSQALTGVG